MLDRLVSRVRLIWAVVGQRLPSALEITRKTFRDPTVKQREAIGRYLHTISSASFIGSFTVLVAGKWSLWAPIQVLLLMSIAVLLFIAGTLFSKGE